MSSILIKDGFLCIAEYYFKCPHCHKLWHDYNDMRLNRINKNKSGNTRVKCAKCGKIFIMTYNIRGDFQTWK